MLIRFGHEIVLTCAAPTPVVTLLSPRPERHGDLVAPERFGVVPATRMESGIDAFGNLWRRFVAPAGATTIFADGVIRDSGLPDDVDLSAPEVPVPDLPAEVLQFLTGSRYVETDRLGDMAWQLFGGMAPGWTRVQAIVDWANAALRFDYMQARATRSAFESVGEGVGVCRDFAHLAIGMCRAMNIPARYCTGYLGDIGIDHNPDPMDFCAWMEVYLGHRWFTFDPRNNAARIGRIVIARGRDAADVPIVNSFGPHGLAGFRVWCDEVDEGQATAMAAQ